MKHQQTCCSEGCEMKVLGQMNNRDLCLEHYLSEATEKLDTTADCFRCGLGVDDETMDWMLLQVDFVVETIGNDSLDLSEDDRSKLLQLLLSVANLNEFIRHSMAVAVHAG